MKYNGHQKYSLFVGRWQPFHEGHKWLIDQALSENKNVCVAIRETEISDKNPYTIGQREEMIKRVYGDRVRVISIPDIESIRIGRNVGYDVIRQDPPTNIGNISGTNVRQGVETRVPPEVAEYISSLRTTLWFTGLPCAGKTTLATRLREELENRHYRTAHLDGDDVREKLNVDLGFSKGDRCENLRRVAHVADLFNKNGNFVLASFVSPTEEMRNMVGGIIKNMKLVYVNCSLEECERRDVKGMYAKARAGEIKDFTGVSALFEEPENPDLIVDTEHNNLETCVYNIINHFNY